MIYKLFTQCTLHNIYYISLFPETPPLRHIKTLLRESDWRVDTLCMGDWKWGREVLGEFICLELKKRIYCIVGIVYYTAYTVHMYKTSTHIWVLFNKCNLEKLSLRSSAWQRERWGGAYKDGRESKTPVYALCIR